MTIRRNFTEEDLKAIPGVTVGIPDGFVPIETVVFVDGKPEIRCAGIKWVGLSHEDRVNV